MADHFDEIPGAFLPSAGAPIPDWRAVWTWAAAQRSADDQAAVWPDLARQWLERIARWRPDGLRVEGYRNFLLLSGLDRDVAQQTLRFMQSCRDQLVTTFPGLVITGFVGPFVGMIFRDGDEYYDYVAEYYPEEGEFGGNAGVYLNQGYGHFALVQGAAWRLRQVLAHEIVHAHFVTRELPLWIEEGLTQTATDLLTGGNSLLVDREMLSRQRAYWREHGLSTFWSGEAFHNADEGQELAYVLSHVTFLRELQDRRKEFLRFLVAASWEDHGAAAAREHLGEPLDLLAAKFLGSEFCAQPPL